MSENSADIAAAVRLRARMQQHVVATESPEQRLARMADLQRASFELLASSPAGWQHFLRRNFASRRVEVIDGIWRPVSPDRRALQA